MIYYLAVLDYDSYYSVHNCNDTVVIIISLRTTGSVAVVIAIVVAIVIIINYVIITIAALATIIVLITILVTITNQNAATIYRQRILIFTLLTDIV